MSLVITINENISWLQIFSPIIEFRKEKKKLDSRYDFCKNFDNWEFFEKWNWSIPLLKRNVIEINFHD